INDDFILPMSIVAQGYLGVQDNRIHALEQEGSTQEQNFARRRRIGAGNMQQIIRLSHLLWPAKHGRISFIFWSGKTLRVACSYLMLLALLGSLYLAPSSMLFAGLAALQLSCYGVAILGLCAPKLQKYAAIQAMSYLVSGHFAIFIGSLRYLCGLEQGRWQKVSASTREKSQ
ncbi:MAG: glycosyltransferase family 2 protein, partial [Shewanella sp.]